MLNLLLVGSGGFIGSALRYLVGLCAQHLTRHSAFPYSTLAANILGCLLIGFLTGLAQQRDIVNASTRLFIFSGMLGGFTTFSTFAYDTFALGRDIGLTIAVLNIFAHIALGLVAILLGLFLARWF